MARKEHLRRLRAGTVINITSRKQETEVVRALDRVTEYLLGKFGTRVSITHQRQWFLRDIIRELRRSYPEVDFHYHFDTSTIRPDGGILFLEGKSGDPLSYPILIAEVKNQGTNDLRMQEGLAKQARGNAIERLGKNVIGLRTALLRETIFPYTKRPISPRERGPVQSNWC